ncbi:MAG: hypothetical protein ACXAEU_04930 [Candidatus Hodarchaeales archaeon]
MTGVVGELPPALAFLTSSVDNGGRCSRYRGNTPMRRHSSPSSHFSYKSFAGRPSVAKMVKLAGLSLVSH